jgi:pimeloyl-[acyl-carrier protein] synthase
VGFDEAFSGKTSAADEMSMYFVELAHAHLATGSMPLLLQGLPELVASQGIDVAGRNLAFLAFAGHETTVHLLGNMLFHFSHEPSAWQALRNDFGLCGKAVTETLRLESPVQKICRWPVQDVEAGGLSLERHGLVVLLLGAANRDPDQFDEPHRFDLTRRPVANLAFGRGAHVCIGRALAEMEAGAMLRALLQRWKHIEPVDGGARWMDNSSLRGLESLELEFVA